MADIAVSVACEVAKWLVAPVGRHCGYIIFSDRRVRKLNVEIVELDHTRQRVQHSIDEAQNNIKRIEANVEKWMKEVDAGITNARKILENDGIAKTACFYGWLPNPKARYRLGKEASRTVKDIRALAVQGRFDKVDYENPPPGLVRGAPGANSSAGDGGNFITNSRVSIFQDIMEALDDEKLKVIGIYGPGGVGKTTLLKKVEKTLKKKGRPFEMIVKVELSRTPDLINIQGQIADALNLSVKDKETQQGRRDLPLQKLQSNPNEKVLIMLDDLWEELNLEAVGIPSGDTSGKCKLLLTSRFLDVLGKMLADLKNFS
ncbi:hypothetical protein BT93_H3175 [Corymbia citriodora subsp. variegata]|nr:hypothetical protein BT93_H3175 [Corymbia citriodora subsp. variegata]